MRNLVDDWEYNFDEISNFNDVNHLSHLIIEKAEKIIPDCEAHFFIYSKQMKEYREEHKESHIPISESSPIITYLALKNTLIERKNIRNEKFIKDDVEARFIFADQLQINILIPFVYRYSLLGFLAIRKNDTSKRLIKKQKQLLKTLQSEAIVNLNAALLVEKRFAELEGLDDIGNEFSSFDGIEQICGILFNKLQHLLEFKIGTLYLYNENQILELKSSIGLKEKEKVYFLKKSESISGHIAEKNKPLLIKKLKENFFFQELNKETYLKNSILCLPLRTKERVIGVLTLNNKDKSREYTIENLHIVSIFVTFLSAAIEKIKLYDSLEKSYSETMKTLASALDAKDSYTKGHSTRVMQYSMGIAKILELAPEQKQILKYAALLHDIGKIGIEDSIIRKQDKLSDKEYNMMKKHVEIGDNMLKSIEFLKKARPFIRLHHERIDGKGYLGITDIPLEAQIISVADSYDAMNSDRSYRKALGAIESANRLTEACGEQFEKKVVLAMIQYLIKTSQLPTNFQASKPKKKRNITEEERPT